MNKLKSFLDSELQVKETLRDAERRLIKQRDAEKEAIDEKYAAGIASLDNQAKQHTHEDLAGIQKFITSIGNGTDLFCVEEPNWMVLLLDNEEEDKEAKEKLINTVGWTDSELTLIRENLKSIRERAVSVVVRAEASGISKGYKGRETSLCMNEDWKQEAEFRMRQKNGENQDWHYIRDGRFFDEFPNQWDDWMESAAQDALEDAEFDYKSSDVSAWVKVDAILYKGDEKQEEEKEPDAKKQKIDQ